jgi:ElaB/YqjD/DUF883 family membrane-anchored ribosome-binding protein
METGLGEIGRRLDESLAALARVAARLDALASSSGDDPDAAVQVIRQQLDRLAQEVARSCTAVRDAFEEGTEAVAEYAASVEGQIGLLEVAVPAAGRGAAA